MCLAFNGRSSSMTLGIDATGSSSYAFEKRVGSAYYAGNSETSLLHRAITF